MGVPEGDLDRGGKKRVRSGSLRRGSQKRRKGRGLACVNEGAAWAAQLAHKWQRWRRTCAMCRSCAPMA
eukprot:6173413-Pleurochrysis_carterae.AAC.1